MDTRTGELRPLAEGEQVAAGEVLVTQEEYEALHLIEARNRLIELERLRALEARPHYSKGSRRRRR